METSALLYFNLGIAIVAIILSIVAIIWAQKSQYWRKLFKREHQPDNLEEVIESIVENIKKLGTQTQQTQTELEKVGETLQTAVQHIAVERFDSGSDNGGNLSFTLALLDGTQTGTIITSMYGRQHNRIYCKAVVNGVPQQILSAEEQAALINALTNSTN